METELTKKMIARADADNLPDNHKLRELALAFENLITTNFKPDKE